MMLYIPASQAQLNDIIVQDTDPDNNSIIVAVWPSGQFGNPNITLSLDVTFSLRSLNYPDRGDWYLTFPMDQMITVLRSQ